MSLRKFLITLLLLLPFGCVSAQNMPGQSDSVVVLMSARSLELMEDFFGNQLRRALDANFLHNNTYLICDSAVWNVDTRMIDAYGNVKVMQNRTVLTSDHLEYSIDDNLARFRGDLVQLQDKDGNTLRTRFLDYNTKDSVAVFEHGASMRDKDGQVIESLDGTYDSKQRLFSFDRNVNMYTDTVYINAWSLDYHTDTDVADFSGSIDAWRGSDMLSSQFGRYEKKKEKFFFNQEVHVMSETQEGWADSLYFERLTNNVQMYGNVQVTDTTRNVSALSDKLVYVDSLSRVVLEKNAAVVAKTNENEQVDTLYVGADKFIYWTVPKCDVSARIVADVEKRSAEINTDPVTEYRRKAAEEAAAKAAENAKEDPNDPEAAAKRRAQRAADAQLDDFKIDADADLSPLDGLAVPEASALSDSLSLAAMAPMTPEDSIAAAEKAHLDSIAAVEQARLDSLANRDTTKIGFLTALGSIKLFRKDMQAACDSLEYSDLDSLARLFKSPVVWNEGNRQYSSDSLYVIIKNQRMERANLLSNAFIIIQEEDTLCFDQIKSTEIMAYFDSTSTLSRFDALGEASALFYLKENDAFATVNKVESKMLSALFVEGEIDRIFYFENPKNDAYPVVQLPKNEREMKGFNWQPDLRPKGKEDITPLELRSSARTEYLGHPMPKFRETETYFPGHMKSIRTMLAKQDSTRAARRREEQIKRQEAEAAAQADSLSAVSDSLGVMTDSLAVAPDSLAALSDSLAVLSDSLAFAADSLGLAADSLLAGAGAPSDSLGTPVSVPAAVTPSARELKQAEAEAKRQARTDAKEEKWAELDAKDAAKAAAKEAKALEKKRRRTLKAVIAAAKEEARDDVKRQRYVRRYEKKRARMLDKQK